MATSTFTGIWAEGKYLGHPITEAQARFENWLTDHGWDPEDDGEECAEDLIGDYLIEHPEDQERRAAITTQARAIGTVSYDEINDSTLPLLC